MKKSNVLVADHEPRTILHNTRATGTVCKVAYHAGPPEISFCGRDWRCDMPQEVTAAEWERMQLRGDFREFDFREVESDALPHHDAEKE
jgi:hypothetical protein